MFVKFFNYFVFHLSSFPTFTTDNVIGRLFVCFILLMKRLFMFLRAHKSKPHQNVVSLTKIIEVIKKLISDNRSPLYTAIRLHDLDVVKHFIEVMPENLSISLADNGSTPLHIGAIYGSEEICTFLLQSGANFEGIRLFFLFMILVV